MTDYQTMFVDSIIEDINTIAPLTDAQFQGIQEKIESRIEAYDNERREQYIKALSESLPRLVSEVI